MKVLTNLRMKLTESGYNLLDCVLKRLDYYLKDHSNRLAYNWRRNLTPVEYGINVEEVLRDARRVK
jgi:hypothetical protein